MKTSECCIRIRFDLSLPSCPIEFAPSQFYSLEDDIYARELLSVAVWIGKQ